MSAATTPRCRAALFDFGGVLTTSVLDAFGDHSERISGDRGLLLRLFGGRDAKAKQLLVDHEEGRLDHDGFEAGLAERLRAHGVEVEAWSPIAQGAVLDDEVIGKIAAAHGRTPSQVTLRWHVERGDIVFPKSMKRERMEENFAIFDFELSPEEIDAISALDRGEDGRRGPNPDTFDYVPA